MVPKAFVNLWVGRHVSVVVLRPIHPILGDVQRDRVVPRLWNAVPAILQWLVGMSRPYLAEKLATNLQATLLFRTIIDARSDNVPSSVHISNVAPP